MLYLIQICDHGQKIFNYYHIIFFNVAAFFTDRR